MGPTWPGFLNRAYAYLDVQQERCKRWFGLGSHERYIWDQNTGLIAFSDGGVVKVEAPVQFVGSISSKTGTWLWAWADESVRERVRRQLEAVRTFGEENGFGKLVEPEWPADETDGWQMTAVTAYILRAAGAYRTRDDAGVLFMVLTGIERVA